MSKKRDSVKAVVKEHRLYSVQCDKCLWSTAYTAFKESSERVAAEHNLKHHPEGDDE